MENEKKINGLKLWYTYNKHKIITYITIVASVLATATIDMHITQFKHAANNSPAGIAFFGIQMLALIQIVNAMSVAKKRSPFAIILYTVINIILAVLLFLYVKSYSDANSLSISSVVSSYMVLIIAFILFVGGNIIGFIFTNWKYVRVKE